MLVSVLAHFFVQFIYRHVPSTNSIPLLPYSLALYLWPSLLFTPSLCLPLFFSFSSNLCQWSRLKGSVHVWTNPCVSDGFQPQSLLALPCREHPPPPPPAPSLYSSELCTCVCLCTCVWTRVYVLLDEGKLLHYSFIPFLWNSPVFCSLSDSSVSTFANLSSIPPLHCCYASRWMLFVVWSSFNELAWQQHWSAW